MNGNMENNLNQYRNQYNKLTDNNDNTQQNIANETKYKNQGFFNRYDNKNFDDNISSLQEHNGVKQFILHKLVSVKKQCIIVLKFLKNKRTIFFT